MRGERRSSKVATGGPERRAREEVLETSLERRLQAEALTGGHEVWGAWPLADLHSVAVLVLLIK